MARITVVVYTLCRRVPELALISLAPNAQHGGCSARGIECRALPSTGDRPTTARLRLLERHSDGLTTKRALEANSSAFNIAADRCSFASGQPVMSA
jgi:hypothetical protein